MRFAMSPSGKPLWLGGPATPLKRPLTDTATFYAAHPTVSYLRLMTEHTVFEYQLYALPPV